MMPQKRALDSPAATGARKRTKATLLSLPDEVIVDVLSYLTQSDALRLLYTSKHFERACHIRLYKDIVICEKPNDAFFRTMVDLQGRTLLSSWTGILSFFSMIFKLVKLGRQPVFLSYVESISSYNYLDSGKIDSYKALSSDDLQNILKLRQMFDLVIESFPNLKSLQLPLIPLDKLQLIKPSILSHLQVLSATINTGLQPKDIPQFNNVHTLTINICSREHTTTEIINALIQRCPRLIHLEINGNFGRQDRRLEHTLRHASLHDDLSPKAQFSKGFHTAIKAAKDKKYLSAFSKGKFDHLDSPDCDSNWYFERSTTEVCPPLDVGLLDGIKPCRLESFRLRNWTVPSSLEFDEAYSWLGNILKESFEHKTLKELDLSNCCVNYNDEGELGMAELFQKSLLLEYEGLEKLILGQTDILYDADYEGPIEDTIIDRLAQFASGFKSKLKELKVYGGKGKCVDLRYYLIKEVKLFHSLKKLTFIDFYTQEDICQRVMSCKAISNYSYTEFSELDDAMFIYSKELVEFMNYTNRVDDYGQYRPGREAHFIERFQKEFLYLFGDDVAEYFKEMPTLDEFVVYGFPFKRSMF